MPDAIATYREADLPPVLVPTLIGNHNVEYTGDIIRFAAANRYVVRGVNFQPVSLVGRMPALQRRSQRVTNPDATHAIEDQTDGANRPKDWFTVPATSSVSRFSRIWNGDEKYSLSIHFACGAGTFAYLDDDRGQLRPITDLLDCERFLAALDAIAARHDYPTEAPLRGWSRAKEGAKLGYAMLRSARGRAGGKLLIDGLWRAVTSGDYNGLADFIKNSVFIGMMHFMDPYNYDVDRVRSCDIHYAMPDGTVVPSCSYNVIPALYRDKVQHEHGISVEEWAARDYASIGTDDIEQWTRLNSETITGREEDEEFLQEGPGIEGYDLKR